jgi:hypothetical protein
LGPSLGLAPTAGEPIITDMPSAAARARVEEKPTDQIDQDGAPESIEVTLNYFVGVMPVTCGGAPGGRDMRSGGRSETHRVVLRNGRPLAGRFALDREGFRFVRHDTKVADFYDEARSSGSTTPRWRRW